MYLQFRVACEQGHGDLCCLQASLILGICGLARQGYITLRLTRQELLRTMVALSVGLAACTNHHDSSPELSSTTKPLMGALTYDQCTQPQEEYLDALTRLARAIASSEALEACVRDTFARRPYVWCDGGSPLRSDPPWARMATVDTLQNNILFALRLATQSNKTVPIRVQVPVLRLVSCRETGVTTIQSTSTGTGRGYQLACMPPMDV